MNMILIFLIFIINVPLLPKMIFLDIMGIC